MKIKYLTAAFLMLGAFILCGEEPVLKNSVLDFSRGVKLVPYTQTVKWISPEERAAKSEKVPQKDGQMLAWKTTLPGESAPVVIETQLKKNADKTHSYSVIWKAQKPTDIKERFLFLNLPLESVKGKKFVFNNKEIPVVPVKKFAWYQLRNRVITMTFYKGEAGREFTLTSKGKIRISCETHPKGNRVWVRIYPVAPSDQVEFLVTVK